MPNKAKKSKQSVIDLRQIPEIVIRKLGKEDSWGQAYSPDFGDPAVKIEIDSRIKKRHRMKIILHESAHIALPGLSEENIIKLANYQSMILYHMGYRDMHAQLVKQAKDKQKKKNQQKVE